MLEEEGKEEGVHHARGGGGEGGREGGEGKGGGAMHEIENREHSAYSLGSGR